MLCVTGVYSRDITNTVFFNLNVRWFEHLLLLYYSTCMSCHNCSTIGFVFISQGSVMEWLLMDQLSQVLASVVFLLLD